MKIVIKIGGSVSIDEAGPNFSYMNKLLPVLKQVKKNHTLVVGIGGGKLTRAYGKNIEKFNISDKEKELVFIELISANVRFLASALKIKPFLSMKEVKGSGVVGGIAPGRSTDANAALVAKKMKADIFIKLTNVDGIYDKDPNKFKDAKKIEKLSFNQLKSFSVKGKPNSYGILDSMAIEALASGKIKTVIINGNKPENILKIIQGQKIGTIIE